MIMMIFTQLLASVIGFICFATFASGATLLPNDEVQALRQIANTLGKTNWNFSANPCGGQYGWTTPHPVSGLENSVTCNCSFNNNTLCHIVSIVLKSQSLPGKLPPELIKLPYLQEIDLTRNYLNGTIPPEWGSMQLVNISLLGNRLTGSIPKEFGNISTLTNLTLEFNQLSGVIPPGLGSLPRIEKLFLTSNNFTGELPGTLANLNTLKSFRIGDNSFTGNIPNYIQNWTNLENLVIQGSGLDGPIPPGIAFLTKLSDLRISDLNGTQSTFPPLNNLTNLKVLILRSCNIIGPLPEYLGPMTNLKTLDLSFNKLSGEIPSSFVSLSKTNYIYLTGNLLSGHVPDWILQNGENIDLSYNNFSSLGPSCQQRTVNLFESSSTGNTSGIVSCLRSFQCPQNWYSFHINCGGKEVTLDGNTKYEADTDSVGPSRFFLSGTNWAFSSTGYFLDTSSSDFFICTNTSRLSMKDSDLYVDARLSPISLTYYGFCLLNGNYTVNLHFAEIMFTDDKTYSSLGRRIFDVYIQGKQVLKNFNIENEAGGVGKEIIKSFTALVTDTTLEIRFYWAGKGTTAIPDKGVYGPLISAISVNPDFVPPSETRNSVSVGAVVGIVAAVVIFLIMLLGILWWRGCLRCKDTMEQDSFIHVSAMQPRRNVFIHLLYKKNICCVKDYLDIRLLNTSCCKKWLDFAGNPDLRGLDLMTGSFTLRQIKAATNNFDAANKIGEGGFGYVYKGLLSDGNVIAVKKLSSKSKQGNREFVNEIGMISALQHPHIVKLYGCCIEGNELLLIYEYMENNSLAHALFGPEEFQLNLDWPTRYKICIGIAKGLAFLHEESRIKIVHRDIKSTNVLLDKDLNPKISDFGLAKLDEEDNTHISTRIAGTYGYMAPEYAMHGYLTDKADVYSFGIVALEIVSGKSNTGHRPKEDCFYILDWALVLKQEGNLMELVDPRLGSDFNKKEVVAMIDVALLCINVSPAVRPTMSSVLSMLESRTVSGELVSDSMVSSDKMEPKEMMIELQQSHETNSNDNQIHSMSNDGPWTASTSVADLYPLTMDSGYWANRD